MKKRFLAILVLTCMLIMTACGGEETSVDIRWWQKTNVYEVYVNSFQDTDGSGYGDLKGITKHLDHLKELGVGALWLTPVFESPMDDNGYDVADYYKINPTYGTDEDMDQLLEEAKKRDIRIVMDLVFNHTSNKCKWFVESEKSKDNEYSDWYIWRDAKPDGSEPNNWRSIFGGSAWTWSETRGQYYLHTFAVSQPDLNWENEKVRQALYDVANYWADKGCGGFRMDAIPYIKKPADFSDGTPDDIDGMTGIHNMTANTEGILDFLKEFKKHVQDGRDIFTVGEANGVPASELDKWVGENGVFDMIFEFSHMDLEFAGGKEIWGKAKAWKLTDLKKALSDSQRATETNGWYPIFFENHDKPRSIDHYFPEDADPVLAGRAMGTVLMTLRGTPFIYEGEELGYKNIAWPSIDDYNDLSSHNQYKTAIEDGLSDSEALDCVHRFSRDNARTPMQWNDSDNAGFTTGKPWLPIHDDYKTENAESEAKDPTSVLSWYQKLAKYRGDTPVLIDGSYREIMADSEQVYAFVRENDDDKLIIAVNFTGESVNLDLSEAGVEDPSSAKIVHSSYEDTETETAQVDKLRPYEAVIIGNN